MDLRCEWWGLEVDSVDVMIETDGKAVARVSGCVGVANTSGENVVVSCSADVVNASDKNVVVSGSAGVANASGEKTVNLLAARVRHAGEVQHHCLLALHRPSASRT